MEQAMTAGHFSTEVEAASAFDYLIDRSGLFRVHREVRGIVLQSQIDTVDKTVRIDRILMPTEKMMKAGWNEGAIGVEIKKSRIKAGPAISQMFDYSRSVWKLPSGYIIACKYYFLYPLEKQHGAIASIMAQNRLGSLCESSFTSQYHRLKFFCGESKVINYYFALDKVEIGNLNFGARVGSR